MMLYLIPLITALVGYGTNWIAVKMLFHPRKRILGFQGVIPKRHDQLARSLSEVFERELVSNNELAGYLRNIEISDDIEELLDARLKGAIENFKGQIPMIGMLLNESMVGKIQAKFKSEILKMLPEFKERLAGHVGSTIDLKVLVEDKVRNFSVRKLESIVMSVASRELRAVEFLGGVLGLIIGLVQVAIMIYL